jgi:predicted transcriptional regulator
MSAENLMYFTEEEELFTDLLIKIGTRKNVAKVLVFLSKNTQAPSRAIEWGADLRQPDVRIALRYLIGMNWIKSRENNVETQIYPMMIYGLANQSQENLDYTESGKMGETDTKRMCVLKLQNNIC